MFRATTLDVKAELNTPEGHHLNMTDGENDQGLLVQTLPSCLPLVVGYDLLEP
jgi:hypothetical protein